MICKDDPAIAMRAFCPQVKGLRGSYEAYATTKSSEIDAVQPDMRAAKAWPSS